VSRLDSLLRNARGRPSKQKKVHDPTRFRSDAQWRDAAPGYRKRASGRAAGVFCLYTPPFCDLFHSPYPTLSLSIDPTCTVDISGGERGRAKRGQASRATTHVHQTSSQTTHSWRHRIGELGEGGLDLPLFASPAYQFGSNQYHSSSVFFSTEQCNLSRFDREKTDQEDPANRQSLFWNAFCFLLAACNSLPSTIQFITMANGFGLQPILVGLLS